MGTFFFFLALALGLIALACLIGAAVAPQGSEGRFGATVAGALLLVVSGLIIVLDSTTTVAARGVAIRTSFGKVRGEPLGPGFHWVAPWDSVEEFDASVQTLKYYQAEKDDNGDCITVRLGNNNTACVDVTAQWNINHMGDVKDLYLSYKTFDNIDHNLVVRQLGSALNEVFGGYDPLGAVDSNGNAVVNTKQLQDQVRADLQRDLGTAIYVDSVTIPIVHFDQATEDRLRAFQQAKADTRIAEQQKLTAVQQAQANQELAKGAAALNDPGVKYQNCLNLVAQLAKENQLGSLPPTFNCNEGANTPVLIQGK